LPLEGGSASRIRSSSLVDAGWPHLAVRPGRVWAIGQIGAVQSPDQAGLGGLNPLWCHGPLLQIRFLLSVENWFIVSTIETDMI
jgi:hypothetical protein